MYRIKQLNSDFKVVEKIDLPIDESGEYKYYRLWKSGLSTPEAIFLLSEALGILRKHLGYAGNKDKRAITEQMISIKSKRDINDITTDRLRLSYVGSGQMPISLGDNVGNHFDIVVREIENESEVDVGESSLQIPNYFDSQRFSSANFEIGLFILRRKFDSAAKAILSHGFGMPIQERQMERFLEQNPRNFIGALRMVDRKMLMLYIHSVQSLIFNEMLSGYIKSKTDTYKTIGYEFGELIFPLEEIENLSLPVIGFDTSLDDWPEQIRDMMKEQLESHGLVPRDFIIREFPELSCESSRREAFVQIVDLQVSQMQDDDLNSHRKKCTLSFSLPKGSYATIAVKSIFG